MPVLSLHKKETVVERRSTGIVGFDELVGGGLPNHSAIVLKGPSGCGKSLFCKQFIWEGLKNGETGLYVALDHPPNEIRESMTSFGWDTAPYEEEGLFMIMDCFNGTLGIQTQEKHYVKNPLDINEQMYVLQECVNLATKKFGRDIKARVVYDSAPLANMRDLPTLFRIARRLLSLAKAYNAIGLSPVHRGAQNRLLENALLGVVDGIIEFDKQIEGGRLNYYLWVDKMMMTAHSRNVHPYVIMDDGIHVMKIRSRKQ